MVTRPQSWEHTAASEGSAYFVPQHEFREEAGRRFTPAANLAGPGASLDVGVILDDEFHRRIPVVCRCF